MEEDHSHVQNDAETHHPFTLKFQDQTLNAKSENKRRCVVLSPADNEPIINTLEEIIEKVEIQVDQNFVSYNFHINYVKYFSINQKISLLYYIYIFLYFSGCVPNRTQVTKTLVFSKKESRKV